jgi:hypothetical protein
LLAIETVVNFLTTKFCENYKLELISEQNQFGFLAGSKRGQQGFVGH